LERPGVKSAGSPLLMSAQKLGIDDHLGDVSEAVVADAAAEVVGAVSAVPQL